ncbi:MAG: glycosyltransferase family 4 protein [Sulfolobales archaeon]|nr:glycosyltransferase family 4 protein [Sulfolobales archaeon]MCX8198639.1 glycosyltransferase family 4 protein [Sulfolobales archaeon]MDW8169713.1 glycosyltransferase family 4 protein [Desulfurococcaceae archaeon]
MKIALVSDWYYPKIGGVASHMHNLAVKLKERGHQVSIVTNNRLTGKEEELRKRGVDLLKVSGVIDPVFNVNLTYSLKSSKELTKFLEDFDVIHSHHAFTPLSLKSLKAGRELEKAALLTTHSISLAYDSRLWDVIGLTIPLFSEYLKYPHRVIAVSKAAEAFIRHFTNIPISVIPNGVDTSVFRPVRNKDAVKAKFGVSGKDVVLYVGRMSYRKGPHVLLNAFASIDNDKAVLVMVGSGDMLPFLRVQTKFLGIEDKVVFMGHVPDEILPEVYRMGDIFVMPSITSEAFGAVILEAMASGLPIVATAVGGIPEILEESDAGLLVTSGNELKLKEAILTLLSNSYLRDLYGENGRKTVEEKYSWDKIIPKIESLYKEVISEIPSFRN